jgi:nitrogen-specific signal transduction histidine kinase
VEIAGNDFDLAIGFDFKGQAIIRQFDPALGPVPGTANELEQVLLNLLKNAAQAIHQREDDSEPGRIILHQAESALGRNPGRRQRRRHERKRAQTYVRTFTTKEIGQGTGLGLSVSYFIITNNHKGQMEVQSTLGQGTCFTLRLPLAGTPLVSQELNQLSR